MSQGIEQILAAARPRTKSVWVCVRGDLLAQHEALEKDLFEAHAQDATMNRNPVAPGIAEQIQTLEAEIVAGSVEFTFAAIGQRAWTDLLVQHQPTDEQLEQWRKEGAGFGYNPLTFPTAAVAASCTSPAMSKEQAEQLYATLNFGQWEALWGACFAANVEGSSAPFSVAASVVLRGSETKSELPGTTESPDPSS